MAALMLATTAATGTPQPDGDRELRVRLVAPGIAPQTQDDIKREVDAIWAVHQIRVVWVEADDARAVRVLLIPTPLSRAPLGDADAQWPVAAVWSLDGRLVSPIQVSLEAAARVARSASPCYSNPTLAVHIVPRVAARAAAHELAHFVLDRPAHAEHGLLRRRFTADELASPVRDPFVLEPEQLAAVRQRLAGVPADRE